MDADSMAAMTQTVKELRAKMHDQIRLCGYPVGSPQREYQLGQVRGMTTVLMLICPNPHED